MLKMKVANEDTDPPASPSGKTAEAGAAARPAPDKNAGSLSQWVKTLVGSKNDTTLRKTIEEYIDAAQERGEDITSVSAQERVLISNILKLREDKVEDVMIPRVDIFAIDIHTSQSELFSLLAKEQYSRIPVYREDLDDIVGTIHIKDIIECLANGREVVVSDLVRDVPIISPSMTVLDLLLMMKQMHKHMALVVDEFGGIDGLVTINDVIETIVGDIEDEYNADDNPEIVRNPDGTLLADARFDIDEFEEQYGHILSEDEREDIYTLGGLAFAIAGRVPAKGEILTHESGMIFEIVDADRRRVNSVLIRNIPGRQES